VALSSLTDSGLFCFISGATFVLQGYYGLSELAFGFSFGSVVIGFISGSFIAQRIVTKLGINGTIAIGMMLIAIAGVSMVAPVAIRSEARFCHHYSDGILYLRCRIYHAAIDGGCDVPLFLIVQVRHHLCLASFKCRPQRLRVW